MCVLLFSFAGPGTLQAAPAEVTRKDGRGPEGDFILLVVRAEGYVLDSEREAVVRKALDSGPVLPGRTFVLLWQPFSPDLFDSNAVESDPFGRAFVRYLHDECYIKDPVGSEYVDHSREETQCYGEKTYEFLSGSRALHTAYRIWGDRLEDSEFYGILRHVILFFSLVVFSLPPLGFALAILALFAAPLRVRPYPQRLTKVLLPLAVGVLWFAFAVWLQTRFEFRGWLVLIRLLFPLGGIFFALAFVPFMWIADHVFFPENDPPRPWLTALAYLAAPIFIAAAGAAGGAARSAVSRPASGGTSGSAAGGGGKFGGGGASAQF